MDLFLTILIALWTYPILALLCVSLTKKNLILRKKILTFVLVINLLTISGLFLGISTISPTIDCFLATLFYFTICLLLFIAFTFKRRFIKIVVGLLMFCVCGIGYLSSTVGILGVGFIVGDYEVARQMQLDKNLTYRQVNLGNATSDYRQMKISVFKNL